MGVAYRDTIRIYVWSVSGKTKRKKEKKTNNRKQNMEK